MKLFLSLILALSLAGCSTEPVAKDINQQQANEIVALLNGQGISASVQKETGAGARYSVSVDAAHLTPAIAILNDRGLPKKSRFSEIIEPHGLIPNSREMESLRIDYARGLEIKELLENHPAVSSAAVTINRSGLEQQDSAGVGVIISQRAGKTITREEVIEIISRLVPGLKPESIALSIHQVDDTGNVFSIDGAINKAGKVIRIPLVPFLFGWRVAEDDYNEIALGVLGFMLLVGFLAGFLGYSYGAYRTSSQDFRASLPEPAVKSGRIDRVTPELPEE